MRRVFGVCLAVGILAGSADQSQAQVSIMIGNPYYELGIGGIYPGSSYGYSNGYSISQQSGLTGYSSGYSSFSNSAYVAGPGALSYGSGYRGYVPAPSGYEYSPPANSYGYPARGYSRAYGYGNRHGNNFRTFPGMGRPFR